MKNFRAAKALVALALALAVAGGLGGALAGSHGDDTTSTDARGQKWW